MDVPFDLWGQRGGAGIDVVGEPQYAGTIRDVLGTGFRPGGSELMVTARLVPEPWNQDAVAIRVGERQVGYLPRHEAARYAPVLSRLVAAGRAPQVAARVRAVSDHRGLTASVWVDLAAPHLIAPVNRAPDGACRLLPPGVAIPVIVDENPLPHPGGEGDRWVYVTLHELVEALPRGSRSVLQVRLDGAVVGRLTPRMSAELLPAVRRLAGNHQLTAARGLLKASGRSPELVVHAARSHELPELWLDSIVAPPTSPSGPLYGSPSAGVVGSGAARNGGSAGAADSGAHWGLIDAGKPAVGFERSPSASDGHINAPAGSPDHPGPRPADGVDGRRRLVPTPRDPGPAPAPRSNGVYHAVGRANAPADVAASAAGRVPPRARTSPPGSAGPATRSNEVVPPPPAGVRFAAPPGWPAPPPGWTPPAGWRPNPAWPSAPTDWQWWVPFWE